MKIPILMDTTATADPWLFICSVSEDWNIHVVLVQVFQNWDNLFLLSSSSPFSNVKLAVLCVVRRLCVVSQVLRWSKADTTWVKWNSVYWNLRVMSWGIFPNQTLIHGYASLLSLHFVYNEGRPGHPQNAWVSRFLWDLAYCGSLSSCRHRASVVLNLRSISKFRLGVPLLFLLWGLVVWLGVSELNRSFLPTTSTIPPTHFSLKHSFFLPPASPLFSPYILFLCLSALTSSTDTRTGPNPAIRSSSLFAELLVYFGLLNLVDDLPF